MTTQFAYFSSYWFFLMQQSGRRFHHCGRLILIVSAFKTLCTHCQDVLLYCFGIELLNFFWRCNWRQNIFLERL